MNGTNPDTSHPNWREGQPHLRSSPSPAYSRGRAGEGVPLDPPQKTPSLTSPVEYNGRGDKRLGYCKCACPPTWHGRPAHVCLILLLTLFAGIPSSIARDQAAPPVQLLSPDPSQPIRGVVSWRIAINRSLLPDEPPLVRIWFLIDGKPLTIKPFSDDASISLDTTAYSNGPHELAAIIFAGASVDELRRVAESRVIVTMDNADAVRALRPAYGDLFLTPGQFTPLPAHWLRTDGTFTPLQEPIEYTSERPGVATVTKEGVVRFVSPGLATITIRAGKRSATARAWCVPSKSLPHFASDGRLLHTYEPGHSIFVRSLFNLGASELLATPALADAIRAAAINTLTTGFYRNPADNPTPNFNQWRKGWLANWQRIERTATKYNLSLILQGDDIARTHAELLNSIRNPWSADAIRFALSKARDSHRVIGVEMIDEITGVYGDTPTPTDGRWQTPAPAVSDDAFLSLMKIINAVPNRPAISWPGSAIATPQAIARWSDPRFSDYVSHYWDVRDFARAGDGSSLAQEAAAMNRTIFERRALLPFDRPQLIEVSIAGSFYVKKGIGAAYTPGQDDLINPGADPINLSAQIMRAVALGAAGIRAYAFDSAWNAERRNAKIGDTLQTGVNPLTSVGADRWSAMSAAFNLIQTLSPHLMQERIDALDLGPDFTTAARQSPDSRLFLAVSGLATPQTLTLDLSPYVYPKGTITRHILRGEHLQTDTFPSTDSLVQNFSPGATVVYLFQPPPQ